jgi:hypothetical protein
MCERVFFRVKVMSVYDRIEKRMKGGRWMKVRRRWEGFVLKWDLEWVVSKPYRRNVKWVRSGGAWEGYEEGEGASVLSFSDDDE